LVQERSNSCRSSPPFFDLEHVARLRVAIRFGPEQLAQLRDTHLQRFHGRVGAFSSHSESISASLETNPVRVQQQHGQQARCFAPATSIVRPSSLTRVSENAVPHQCPPFSPATLRSNSWHTKAWPYRRRNRRVGERGLVANEAA